LAETIAKSSRWKAQVPSTVLGLLAEVITLRKEVTSWLGQLASNDQSWAQNDSHGYYIYVLEQVRGILKPREAPLSKKIEDQVTENSRDMKFPNVFHSSSIEESQDVALSTLDTPYRALMHTETSAIVSLIRVLMRDYPLGYFQNQKDFKTLHPKEGDF